MYQVSLWKSKQRRNLVDIASLSLKKMIINMLVVVAKELALK